MWLILKILHMKILNLGFDFFFSNHWQHFFHWESLPWEQDLWTMGIMYLAVSCLPFNISITVCCYFCWSCDPKQRIKEEWTIMWTMDFGWLWCANIGSLVVTHDPLWWGILLMGEAMHVSGREYIGNRCAFSILLWTLNWSKK